MRSVLACLLFGAALLAALSIVGCKPAGTTDACSPACSAGTTCVASACVPGGLDMTAPDAANTCTPACSAPTPFCNAHSQCVACLADADCPTGNVCRAGLCASGCTDDSRCPTGQKCCASQCTDPMTDSANCGACGTACTAAHAQATCTAGACATGACLEGWGDCDMDAKNGCEANLHIDPSNCGTCGTVCAIPHAINACSDGCYMTACQFGFDDCNGDPKDGCETSVLTDANNCGACGQSCSAPPHAQASCAAATCLITMCEAGYADCDNNPTNGCEVAIATDANNCGACGAACAQGLVCQNGGCTCPQCNIPNAKSACVNNVCTFVSCLPGYSDCDNNAANGCEANLQWDVNNCGGCNMACPQGQTCQMGVCAMVSCMRIGWKTGNQDWSCPNGLRMPTINEYNTVAPCITQGDQAMFSMYQDIGISVGGCNCKWNNNWCGQPSIETMRQGRACGDYSQLQICVN